MSNHPTAFYRKGNWSPERESNEVKAIEQVLKCKSDLQAGGPYYPRLPVQICSHSHFLPPPAHKWWVIPRVHLSPL
jgi:hypothetical protein